MNITRRRGAIAFFITLGAILVGLTITQSAWILLNERTVAFAILGIILFAILDAGDEDSEENDAEDGKGDGALVEEDPGALGDGEADENRAEGDEEGDGSAASGDVHAGQECISGGAALSISRSYG